MATRSSAGSTTTTSWREGYGTSVIPGEVQSRYDSYDLAVEHAKRFARYAAADLWYTEDELTFVLLEICRRPTGRTGGAR